MYTVKADGDEQTTEIHSVLKASTTA